jgi:SAM-dependent methyltransferase
MTTLDPAGPNASQVEYWNVTAGPNWVASQESRDIELAPWGLKAMEALGPKPGERIVDVGCGCGATTLELARRVGPGGDVLGADISAPMLAVARRRAGAEGLAQARFIQADAQTHAFEPADGVFSRFGVMFFADPVAAFANLRRAMRPGGRLGFVCWRPMDLNAWVNVPMSAVVRLLPEPPPAATPGAPGPFAFADPDRVRGVLRDAGWREIEIVAHDMNTSWGDLDASTRTSLTIGPVAGAVRLNPDLADKMAEAVRAALAPYETPDGVLLDSSAWVVRAAA